MELPKTETFSLIAGRQLVEGAGMAPILKVFRNRNYVPPAIVRPPSTGRQTPVT